MLHKLMMRWKMTNLCRTYRHHQATIRPPSSCAISTRSNLIQVCSAMLMMASDDNYASSPVRLTVIALLHVSSFLRARWPTQLHFSSVMRFPTSLTHIRLQSRHREPKRTYHKEWNLFISLFGTKTEKSCLNSKTIIWFYMHCNDRRFAPKYLSSFCSIPKMYFPCCVVAKQRWTTFI